MEQPPRCWNILGRHRGTLRKSTAPVVPDPAESLSAHLTSRTCALIDSAVQLRSVDGQDARERAVAMPAMERYRVGTIDRWMRG